MKLFLSALLYICAINTHSYAQTDTATTKKPVTIRICAPSRNQLIRQPMYVIIFKGKAIFTSDTIMSRNTGITSMIKPQEIKGIEVVKGTAATARYGDMAKNGLIEITLDDKKFPKAWKSFRPDYIRIKLKRDSIAKSLRPDTVRYRP